MTRVRPIPYRRLALAAAALALALIGVATALAPATSGATPRASASIADGLGPLTRALAIPTSWIAAPIPGLRAGDVLDLLGTRPGERATATEVASGLRIVSADDRAIVVEITAEDASAIASARSRGLSLIPLLRSSR